MNEWLCARKSRHEALASEQQASFLQADPAEDGVEARKGRTQRRGGFYCLRSLELVSWLVGWAVLHDDWRKTWSRLCTCE